MEPSQAQLKSIMDMARESWASFSNRMWYLLGLMVVSMLIPLAAAAAGMIVGTTLGAVVGATAGVTAGAIAGGVFIVLGYVAAVYLGIMSNLAIMSAVADEQLRGIKAAFQRVSGRTWGAVVVSLIMGVIIFVGYVLLIIPGVYFSLLYSFGLWAYLLEQKKGMDALNASKELVRGRWWRVFGQLLGFGLLVVAIVFLPQLVLTAIGLDFLGVIYNLVASIVASPVATIYVYKLYQNLKSVKVAVPQTGMKM